MSTQGLELEAATATSRKTGWGLPRRAMLLAGVSGGLQVLIFPSADWGFLCWVCVAPLLVAIFRPEPDGGAVTARQGFLLGYITGLIWSFGSCYWIYNVMHTYGGLNPPVAAGVEVLFSLAMALSWGVFGCIMAWLASGR